MEFLGNEDDMLISRRIYEEMRDKIKDLKLELDVLWNYIEDMPGDVEQYLEEEINRRRNG